MTPHRFLLLELFKVKHEFDSAMPFAFSLVFEAEPDKKHIFSCTTQDQADEWVKLLKSSSYQTIKYKIKSLQKYLIHKTGIDPLSKFQSLPMNIVN